MEVADTDTVDAAAKKPGGRALLLALALCGLTALGAAVFNLANNGEARNMAPAEHEQQADNKLRRRRQHHEKHAIFTPLAALAFAFAPAN